MVQDSRKKHPSSCKPEPGLNSNETSRFIEHYINVSMQLDNIIAKNFFCPLFYRFHFISS